MKTGLAKVADWRRLAIKAHFNPHQLADLCLISDRQLQRFFKNKFQTTPGKWLRKLQCNEAKELIENGYSTKAAAAETNFANSAHFCREFRKQFGVSPQAHFVEKMQPEKASLLDNNVVYK